MENNIGRIKINTQNKVFNFTSEEIKKISGLVSVEIKENILYYEYLENASDYDIMVAIMNYLDSLGIDSEPLFEDEPIAEETQSEEIINGQIESEETSLEEINKETEVPENTEEVEEDEKLEAKAKKIKLIEMGISLLTLIIGIIVSSAFNETIGGYIKVFSFVIIGYEVIFEAIEKIFKKQFFSEDLLMSVASLAAIAIGETIEATGIMLLFCLGELFEDYFVDNSKKIIDKLKDLNPLTVRIIDENGVEKEVEPSQVEVGSIIICKAGEKVAIDGEIIEGKANIDIKALTGESTLKSVEEGSEILGGSINIDGLLKIKTTKTYQESAVNKIVDIVNDSSTKKAKKEKFIEKFAKIYTPCVFVLALIVAFVLPIFTGDYEYYLAGYIYKAIMLLCVSCPCAIVVSIPLAYFIGSATAATNGVLCKGSVNLESLAGVDTFAFDKTGTLTEGKFKVSKILATEKYKGKVLYYAGLCEKNSNHPLALAIKEKCGEITENVSEYTEIAGRGILVKYNGETILCGNDKLLKENNIKFKENSELGMKLYVAVNNEFAGVIVLTDTIKKNAYGAIKELNDIGIYNTIMLTGDNKEYAVAVRKELNIKKSVSELLPQDKLNEVENLINNKDNKGVCFVGDGINDAPCLTRATVGISMGGIGSDIAIESSDIVITDDDMKKVPFIVKLAKRTNNIAKQNIALALTIKGIVIFLSLTGLYTSLWLAIASDVGVLLVTILNSIRNKFKVL